jgi:hypothetical protein
MLLDSSILYQVLLDMPSDYCNASVETGVFLLLG